LHLYKSTMEGVNSITIEEITGKEVTHDLESLFAVFDTKELLRFT